MRATSRRVKRHVFKAATERGRKRSDWGTALQIDPLSEFELLRKAGVKFIVWVLRTLDLPLVEERHNQSYASPVCDPTSRKCNTLLRDV